MAPSIGTVADGGTTNDTAPALAGTLSAILGVGEVLSIFRDGVKIGVADVAGTNWTFSDAGPLVDGTSYTYTARVVDAANNLGPASNAYDITIDTSNPTAAVDITAIADDTGTAGDFITSDTTLTVSGTNGALGAGEKVQVSSDGGATWSTSSQDTGTTWSYDDPATHGASFTYQARVIDAAANVGNTDSQAVTIDTSNPTAAVDITAIADDTGTAGDFTTSDTTLTVSGTNGALGAGEKVQVSSDGGATWVDVIPGHRHDLELCRSRHARRGLHLPGAGDRRGGQCRQQRQPGGHHRHQQSDGGGGHHRDRRRHRHGRRLHHQRHHADGVRHQRRARRRREGAGQQRRRRDLGRRHPRTPARPGATPIPPTTARASPTRRG